MQNFWNIISLIDRKGRVRLQECNFLAVIQSLQSAKIVLSIKTRQEVDCFDFGVFKVNEYYVSKTNTQQRAGLEARKRGQLRSAQIQTQKRASFEAEKREQLYSSGIAQITGIARITQGSARRRPNHGWPRCYQRIYCYNYRASYNCYVSSKGWGGSDYTVYPESLQSGYKSRSPGGLKMYLKVVKAKKRMRTS